MTRLLLFMFLLHALTLPAQDLEFWRGSLVTPFRGDADTVFAVVNNNIYKLKDQGQSWIMTAPIPSGPGNAEVRIDSAGNLWLTRSDGTISVSSDEGLSWQNHQPNPEGNQRNFKVYGDYMLSASYYHLYGKKISSTVWDTLYSIAPDESMHDVLMTQNGYIYISFYNFRIKLSTDGGVTWTECVYALDNGGDSTAASLSSPDRLAAIENKVLVSTYWNKVLYSDDNGVSWTQSAGEFGISDSVKYGAGVTELIVSDENEVYALVKDQLTTRGWVKSSDGGASFSKVPFPYNHWVVLGTKQLVVQGSNLYLNAGDWGFFFSPDDGNTWTPINNGIDNVKPHHAARILEDSAGTWWALMTTGHLGAGPGSSWGVLRSTDKGNSWLHADDSLRDEYNTLEDLLVAADGTLYVTAYTPNTYHKSSDQGSTWTKHAFSEPDSTMQSTATKLAEAEGYLYAATYWDNLQRSDDGGQTWEELEMNSGAGTVDFDVDSSYVYAISGGQSGNLGLYKSENSGDTLIKVSTNGVYSFSRILHYDSLLYAVQDGQVFVSGDEGINWANVQPPFGSLYVRNLSVAQLHPPDAAEGVTYPYLLAGSNNGLYATRVGMADWKKVTDGWVYSISEVTSDELVLVGYEKGYLAVSIHDLLDLREHQTITFDSIPPKTFNDDAFVLNATASSGLPLTFVSSNEGTATVSGNTVTITGAGTTTITATQAGDELHYAATAERLLFVAKAAQTITFSPLPDVSLMDSIFTLNAIASSELPVSYEISGPAALNGSTVTLQDTGRVTITAYQAGNSNYFEASPVSRSFTVYDDRADQTITFSLPDSLFVDESPYALEATTTSGMTVSLEIVSGDATLEGTSLVFSDTGRVEIRATQAGDASFKAAAPVSRSVVIKPLNSVSGTVTGPGGEIVAGVVQAISSGGQIDIEVSMTDSVFTIITRLTGAYYLKFVPDSDGYHPAYYDGVIDWEQAEVVSINGNISGVKWETIPKENGPLDGTATISGQVVKDGSGGRTRTEVVNGRVKNGIPVEGVVVYLLDNSSGDIVTQAITNESGEFEMNNIPAGTYRLFVDVTGVSMDDASSVITVAENAVLELTSIVGAAGIITEVQVVTGIETGYASGLAVYPNPAGNVITIEIPGASAASLEVALLNSAGTLLKEAQLDRGLLQLDVSGAPAGLYYLRVTSARGELVGAVKVIKR